MKQGAFTFVLHSHLPYCRNAGRWPHGEEWIHEAASETYIPLLNSLYNLKERGVKYKLTVSLTPVLLEQLSDSLILGHLDNFLEDEVNRAAADVEYYQKTDNQKLVRLARFYFDRYTAIRRDFNEKFERNLIKAFKQLQDEGYVEIAVSAATHAYLPLLDRDSSIYAQLKTGTDAYRGYFKKEPHSIWMPECGYRPAYFPEGESGRVRPGLEAFLKELKLKCFFVETHTIEGGAPVGKAMGEVIGPYGNIARRYVVPVSGQRPPTKMSTYQPYYVSNTGVAVLGRNNRTGLQVWSADWGYPGDHSYREFHKKDGRSGLQYWKVTGTRVDLALKEIYDPEQAMQIAAAHASHYSQLVESLISRYYEENKQPGIIVAAYDTELFGHWWFEGIEWIEMVLSNLSRSNIVELVTPSEYLRQNPVQLALTLPESSWGQGGAHFTWLNYDTRWMWPHIYEAEKRMEKLAGKYPDAEGVLKNVLNQAARELLLLQSSDWPFLVTTGQAREYAITRFNEHCERFGTMAQMAEEGCTDGLARDCCEQMWEKDKIFPDIDYRNFRRREA